MQPRRRRNANSFYQVKSNYIYEKNYKLFIHLTVNRFMTTLQEKTKHVKMTKTGIVMLLLFLIPIYSIGQEKVDGKDLIGIDFFTKIKTFSRLKEQNGDIFFVLRETKKEENTYNSDLYQLKDGNVVRITNTGDVSDYFFFDDAIVFRGLRKAEDREARRKGMPLTVFQKLTKEGYQEATEWFRLPYNVGEIEFIDADHFFFTASHNLLFEQWLEESNGNYQEALRKREEDRPYRVFDELPFWSNGRGDINGSRSYLYYYNNGEVTKLSSSKYESVNSLKLSPDKKTLIFTQREFQAKSKQSNKLMSVNTSTLEIKDISPIKDASFGSLIFEGNDKLLIRINKYQEIGLIENNGIHRLDMKTGDVSLVYSGEIYGMGNTVGSDIKSGNSSPLTSDKEGVVYISTVVDKASLVRINAKDTSAQLLTPDNATVLEYLPVKYGYLMIAMVDQQAGEIYHVDKKKNLKQLSSVNTSLFASHHVLKPIEVIFKNDVGMKLNGFVIPPVGYEKGKKYPTILTIHGGPKTTYGTVFFHEMQYLANQGYAIIYTNPRGSDGRGVAYADLLGKYGDIDYKDITAFVDEAIKQHSFIDEDRLGVTGGSYGGFMTNWIIGHTDRFKAAVSLRGIASWLSFSNTSDIGTTFIRSNIGPNAWEDHQELWDKSPLKYADNVKTPTLFIHSEEDYRCWLVEGIQMYTALQYFEVPTRLVVFKGENHELSRSGKPKNRLRRLEELKGWFDKYL